MKYHDTIKKMREDGNSYKAIALFLSIPKSTVQSYCRRNKIKVNYKNKENSDLYLKCLYCKKELEQKSKLKPKKFCSDKCRHQWWSLKNGKKKICDYCNQPYISSIKTKKYCSHECYINDRFKGGKLNDTQSV